MHEPLSIFYGLPFVGLLLSMAILPLKAPHFWEHKQGWIVLFWSLTFALPYSIFHGFGSTFHLGAHTLIKDYIPFLILITTLYVAAGGLYLTGGEPGNPFGNVLLLAFGTVLASLVGTTGASMVMIRPVIRSISKRDNKAHTVIFFIFLVSNIGGSLTPIGDPPLFLGFLHGVDFLWPLRHCSPPMIFCSIVLLGVYFALDSWYFKKERATHKMELQRIPLDIRGASNIVILLAVVATVVGTGTLSKIWTGSVTIPFGSHAPITIGFTDFLRDGLLVGLLFASLKTTPHGVREANGFTWAPIQEVARLFAGIFATLIPLILILQAGTDGALGWLVEAVSTPARYFWAAGTLSSFLDNAPTYLLFFNVAGG
ncbi:MAG TPA: sodium:proton antiporter, partial [Fibrobacteria bacterium]|nr:sodium:proton antiporter [Fibrobacteria bacterium]